MDFYFIFLWRWNRNWSIMFLPTSTLFFFFFVERNATQQFFFKPSSSKSQKAQNWCKRWASLDCPRLYMSSMIGVKSIGYLRCSAITMSVPVGNWSLLSQLVLPMGLVQDQVINALHSNMCILVTRVWAIGHHTSIPQKAEERTVCSTQLKYPQCNHHAMDVLHSYWNPYDSRGLGRAVAMLAAGTMVHNDFPFLPPFLLISRRFIPGFAFSP